MKNIREDIKEIAYRIIERFFSFLADVDSDIIIVDDRIQILADTNSEVADIISGTKYSTEEIQDMGKILIV